MNIYVQSPRNLFFTTEAFFGVDVREWTEDGQLWIQYVSSTPATRLDVINLQVLSFFSTPASSDTVPHLQEQLDLKLQQRQARETGICPVREELYAQCFGELQSRAGSATETRFII